MLRREASAPSLVVLLGCALAACGEHAGGITPAGPSGESVDAGADAAGGSGASSGDGGHGGGACTPGATTSCYDGPPGTAGVGVCEPGARTCNAAGVFGPCVGQVLPSEEACATAQDEDCDGNGPECGAHLWTRVFPGGPKYAGSVAVDAQANVFVSGAFVGDIDLGGGVLSSAGGSDGFLARLDAAGAPVWSKRFGDQGDDTYLHVAIAPNGDVLLAGSLLGTADLGGGPLAGPGGVLARLAPDGSHLWSLAIPGATFVSLVAASAAELRAVGTLSDPTQLGASVLVPDGQGDVLVVDLDDSGAIQGAKRLGGPGFDVAYGADASSTGSLLVWGSFETSADFGSGALNAAEGSFFVARLDTSAKAAWARASRTAWASGALGDNDSALVEGYCDPAATCDAGGGAIGAPIAIARYGAAGDHEWSRGYGNVLDSNGAVALDSAEHALISGTFHGSIDLEGHVLDSPGMYVESGFVASFAPDGSHGWSAPLTGQSALSTVHVSAAAVSPDDAIIAFGEFSGAPVDFGGGPVVPTATSEVFVSKRAR